MDNALILKRMVALLIAAGHVEQELVNETYRLAIGFGDSDGGVYEDPLNYDTIEEGKWWLFFLDVPVRPLSDAEAAKVVWGNS